MVELNLSVEIADLNPHDITEPPRTAVAMFAAREISVASGSPRLLDSAAYFVDRELPYVDSCDSVECRF